MKFKDVLSIIRFNTSTTDDLSGKTAQNLFTNQSINQQLGLVLDKYASFTKAIESIWSAQAVNTANVITAPPDVIRNKGVRFAVVFNKGIRYPLIEKDQNNIYGTFYVQNIVGIPRWFEYFANEIRLYPTNSQNPITTTLATDITKTDTTITLTDTVQLPPRNGRITIGSEKIYYASMTGNVLSDCIRGSEGTVAVAHDQNDIVTENNIHIYYRKLHWKAVVPSDNKIDEIYADREMELPDEHVQTVTDYTSYLLLNKVDPTRAQAYKVNFDEWLQEVKYQVDRGRSEIQKTDDVRDQLFFEIEESPFFYY